MASSPVSASDAEGVAYMGTSLIRNSAGPDAGWGASAQRAAVTEKRRGNTINGVQDIRAKNGASQGQNLAVTVFCAPNLLPQEGRKFCLCRQAAGNPKEEGSTLHPKLQPETLEGLGDLGAEGSGLG